jgi:hypothetical protein
MYTFKINYDVNVMYLNIILGNRTTHCIVIYENIYKDLNNFHKEYENYLNLYEKFKSSKLELNLNDKVSFTYNNFCNEFMILYDTIYIYFSDEESQQLFKLFWDNTGNIIYNFGKLNVL